MALTVRAIREAALLGALTSGLQANFVTGHCPLTSGDSHDREKCGRHKGSSSRAIPPFRFNPYGSMKWKGGLVAPLARNRHRTHTTNPCNRLASTRSQVGTVLASLQGWHGWCGLRTFTTLDRSTMPCTNAW